jgi:hypothetical protein
VLQLAVDSLTNFVAKLRHIPKRDALKFLFILFKRKLLVLSRPSRAVPVNGTDRYAFYGLNSQGSELCAAVLSNFKWFIPYNVIMICI